MHGLNTTKGFGMIVLKVILFCALLSLISCGSDSDSKSSPAAEASQDALCSAEDTSINCLKTVDWKISIASKTFPSNAKIDINGINVVDECFGSKVTAKINRSTDPMILKLKQFIIPTGAVKVHVSDQGAACDKEEDHFNEENMPYDVVKTAGADEIHMNL